MPLPLYHGWLNGSSSDEELQVFDDNEEAEIVTETVLDSINNSDEIGMSETNQLGKEDEVLIRREILPTSAATLMRSVGVGLMTWESFRKPLLADRMRKRKTKDKMVRNAKILSFSCQI